MAYTPYGIEYNEGDIVTYAVLGSIERRTCVIVDVDDDINGRPGFIGELPSGGNCWGYDYQIVSVKRA